MIPFENCFLLTGFTFHILCKIICSATAWHNPRMSSRTLCNRLRSIPENPDTNEMPPTRWVPKKKHEVLKAKYICLKKLFQVYDATLYAYPDAFAAKKVEEPAMRRRKRRTHRCMADALVGTASELISEKIATEDNVCTCKSQTVPKLESEMTFHTEATECCSRECNTQTITTPHPIHVPNLQLNEKRKLTRFQCFIHRMIGISSNRSDLNLCGDNHYRHRRSFRIKRSSRAKRVQSECGLRDPAILSYVQNVQRNCLMDSTPRKCPIVGCKCMLYGIINYNDHLNLCHFPKRKHICHYCHEGFDNEYDLFVHENEHIGLTKLQLNRSADNCPPPCCSAPICDMGVQRTQSDTTKTENDEILKKIVSFFDSIDPEVLNRLQKNRASESSLRSKQSLNSGKRSVSCTHTLQTRYEKANYTMSASEASFGGSCKSSFVIPLPGTRRNESGKSMSKFRSCVGLLSHRSSRSANEKTDVESSSSSKTSSGESLSCDPSTNIVYYSSKETVKKESTISMLSQKLKKGIKSYKWEPQFKDVRVRV